MDFTVELSKMFSLSPFEVLKQDKDAVIMMINYYIEKGKVNPTKETNLTAKNTKKQRIRVNDKTATGGWF